VRVDARVYVLKRALAPRLLLWSLGVGESIRNIAISIEDAFNDPFASVSIGTEADPELLMKKSECVVQVAGEYRAEETYLVASGKMQIYVFIEPKDSTSGIARLFFEVATGPVP